MRLRFTSLLASIMLLVSVFQYANAAEMLSQMPGRQPDFVEMPQGVSLPVMLIEKISTVTSQVGQPVRAAITQDIFVGPRKVLSRSDRVIGRVTKVEKPIPGRNAILQVQFESIKSSNGLDTAIESYTNTGQDSHYWGGEITEGLVPEIIPYRVWRVGTYGRVLMQGPRAFGTDVTFNPGSRFVIVLMKPITLIGE
jgi:hypothetical protein